VVVEGEQEAIAGAERVRLAHEMQRPGRVRREDRDVLRRGGPEEGEDRGAGGLDELGHRRRGRVLRVRVAEDAAPQQLDVLDELRLSVEPGPGVVEVDVPACVEPGEVTPAQILEDGRGRLGRGAGHSIHPEITPAPSPPCRRA
jgi:hypothetical protein